MEILTVGCSHTVGHTNIWQVAVRLKKLAIIIITIRFVWHGRVQHGVVYSPTLLQPPGSLFLVPGTSAKQNSLSAVVGYSFFNRLPLALLFSPQGRL